MCCEEMGQEQSQYISSAAVDQAQIPQRHRAQARSSKPRKLPAEQRLDAFMKHTEAPNRIRPIRETEKEGKKKDEDLYGDFDVTILKKKKDKEREFSPVRVMDLPAAYEPTADETSSSEEDDVGLYHHEVEKLESEDFSITSPAAHPVAIDGEAEVGKDLRLRDLSPYQREFPVTRVEWYLGLYVGDTETLEVHYAQQQSGLAHAFRIPAAAVGKYITAKAYRNVENQLNDRTFGGQDGGEEEEGKGKTGAYDQHIGGGGRALHKVPEKLLRVCSSSTTGPVLLPDAWCYVISKALSKGAFSCACLLRDTLQDGAIQPLDGNKVSSKARKCPGTLLLEEGEFRISYAAADSATRQQNEEAAKPLAVAAALLQRAAGLDEKSQETQPKILHISAPLRQVHVRPSKAAQTIVAVLQLPRGERAGESEEQQIVRFDVDPAIGRDVVLYVVLAFQAAAAEGNLNRREKWRGVVAQGDFNSVKLMVQEYLERLCTQEATAVPAFAKMPTTPWEVFEETRRRAAD